MFSLEDKLQPELNDPRIIGRRYLAKEAARDVRRRIGKLRTIQDIEELRAELHT